jgi:hypothetical protein
MNGAQSGYRMGGTFAIGRLWVVRPLIATPAHRDEAAMNEAQSGYRMGWTSGAMSGASANRVRIV